MSYARSESTLLVEHRPQKVYTTSILKIAGQYWTIRYDEAVRDLAEELRARSTIPVVAVVDEDGRAMGIVRMARLFEMLGKPFGLEILGKARVAEITEDAPRLPAGAELFGVAEETLSGQRADHHGWHLLEYEDGRFAGLFSAQDLSEYLSKITREDIEHAGRLQERLIAGHDDVSGKGWRFEGWSRSAKGIGGDLYYAKAYSDDESFFCLSDISGKGVSASVLVSMAYGMLRMHDHARGLDHLIRTVNATVVEAFHLEKYLTGVFMTWNSTTRKLTLADMGHSHCLVFRHGSPGRIKSLKTNLPLGIEPDITPQMNILSLKPGDVVFIYSDGLTEQEDANGVEFGEKRLWNAVSSSLKEGIPIARVLPAAFDAHRGSVPLQDDATFVALHVV
ncbi:MAG: SpoIIE family protein phosphatase [Spirochaetales bacterium]|nr:SpoIIE family protein phosphatase [Spirochaetales bacterium]